jgi:hypothetical protein
VMQQAGRTALAWQQVLRAAGRKGGAARGREGVGGGGGFRVLRGKGRAAVWLAGAADGCKPAAGVFMLRCSSVIEGLYTSVV